MVIANLDGQVERIFRLNAGREKIEQARNDAAQDNDDLTTDSSHVTSQTAARKPERDEREESTSNRTSKHKQNTSPDLDDAALPVWLL